MPTITIQKKKTLRRGNILRVEFNRFSLERLASACGWFQETFLAGLDRSEKDIREGRVKTLKSFRNLRS